MYVATCLRPDISFAVGELGRFTHQPTHTHLTAEKRVLRYLQGTKELQLVYGFQRQSNKAFSLIGFADADYASDVDQRRSVTGYIFTCNDSPIAWKSKRQPMTATSTSEAEYMALCDSSKEAIVLSRLLSELTHADPLPVIIHEANRAASLMAKGESSMKRSKHVDVRYHLIKDSVQHRG